MVRPSSRTAATVAATAALLAAGMSSAPAATGDVSCSGSLTDRVVAGDLVVPTGAECRVDGGSVAGKVVVRSGASLAMTGTKVTGGIVASGTGSVSLDEHADVAGLITMSRAAVKNRDVRVGGFVTLHDSSVGGIHVAGKAAATPALVEVRVLSGSTVEGGVNAAWSEVSVADATVRGPLNVSGGGVGTLQVDTSNVFGRFTTENFDTQVLCGSNFRQAARFNEVGGLYVGDNPSGPGVPCGGNSFQSSLTSDNGTLGVFVENHVRGVATGVANDQMVLRNNNFSGGTQGDFTG